MAGVFAPDELKAREQVPYVFLSGAEKAIVEIEGSAFEDRSAEMVILDTSRKPLFVSGLKMLLPKSP